ncbi:MAG TPA: ABC transporter ATP-binding protein [Candidatus Hydrogenedentes bacterium]|nr:ABC transporter ATP-binding protein [Candidatus Hydrogenedentota bacterium]HQH52568.1 ABC transporter ATP-binding protein [Candidatus Hydrogenedentota bacterium]
MAAESGNGTIFRVENLKKDYPMGEVTVRALRDVSLEVSAGEFLVILGPSGSGKSTLLNIIGGIDSPTAGRVFFKDEELTGYSEPELTRYRRRHIGFVFQFYNLMPNLTALENVEMATEISANPMVPREALRLVGLDDRRDHFPSQLSGGEQQRVAIARAVAKQPEILLCDEPTGALDFQTGKVVLEMLQHINDETGTTVIVITHNAAIGKMAHRVIRMMDGHVREIIENAERLEPSQLEW